jgi:trehalose/maltose transport system substrate-binding protein
MNEKEIFMQKDEFQTQLRELVENVSRGKLSRREAIRRAGLLGVSAPVAAMLIRSGMASAQDATPTVMEGEVGSTIVVPANLRTDLSGQEITVVLAEASSPDVPFLDAAHAKFTEATGITVNRIPGEQSATDRLAIYNQQLGAQSSDIDVLQIDVIWPGILAQHAHDLNEALSDLASQHFPAIVENNTVDGKLVGMPWFTDAGLLYYRQDLLEKYGLEVPTTWEEFTTAAQTIQDGERAEFPDFWGFVFQGNAYEGLTCNGLEWQYSNGGGRIVEDVDGTPTVTLNNENAVAAFELARSWIGTISPEGVTTYQEPDSLNVFIAGNAAFLRNWPYAWSASQDPASAIAGKVGVTSLPMGSGEGASHAATLGGWQLMVSTYSEAKDAAVEYVRFMCSPEVQMSYAAERSHLPTIASVYDDPTVAASSEFIPRLKDVFQGGAVARPSSITSYLYNDVSIAYFTGLNQILTGQTDAQSAVDDITSQIEDIISEL